MSKVFNGSTISVTVALTILAAVVSGYTYINSTYATKDSVENLTTRLEKMDDRVFFMAQKMGYKGK
jgi:hypothetical protein